MAWRDFSQTALFTVLSLGRLSQNLDKLRLWNWRKFLFCKVFQGGFVFWSLISFSNHENLKFHARFLSWVWLTAPPFLLPPPPPPLSLPPSGHCPLRLWRSRWPGALLRGRRHYNCDRQRGWCLVVWTVQGEDGNVPIQLCRSLWRGHVTVTWPSCDLSCLYNLCWHALNNTIISTNRLDFFVSILYYFTICVH